jgi:hypothetical protein
MRDRIHDTAKVLAVILGSLLFGLFLGLALIRPAS